MAKTSYLRVYIIAVSIFALIGLLTALIFNSYYFRKLAESPIRKVCCSKFSDDVRIPVLISLEQNSVQNYEYFANTTTNKIGFPFRVISNGQEVFVVDTIYTGVVPLVEIVPKTSRISTKQLNVKYYLHIKWLCE